ncbi:MAG: aminoglycoside phosphotransferase family protein [Betaproteobacteria bacterium]|nr:aminoglycoside phosphotransferase family protein [Betaproteobacteria bacterium]
MKIVSADQQIALTPLAGGVSSDIFRADLPSGVVCVKRALTRLKVAADWQVPVERNRSEVEWMRVAAAIVPDAVPAILGEDREACAFAMAWLPPQQYPVWKELLAAGTATDDMAARVGDTLGRIHAATADRPELARRFANDALFHALRLDPYLVTAAGRHPRQAARLLALVDVTAGVRRTLVHGDFSPKNILVGPRGPVILDAECAVYGDPAFDLAFVLNHLLLKGVWHPSRRDAYAAMARTLIGAYLAHVGWEDRALLEARAAALLPGLLLARVDGKSPVEYVTGDGDRDAIRDFACAHLDAPVAKLEQLLQAWTT